MIKLVVCDMDGTLIGNDEVLSHLAVKMVDALKQKRIAFTIATGRVEAMADTYVEKLGITIPYILCNGVTLRTAQEIFQRNVVPVKGLRPLFQQADDMGMSLVYSIRGKEWVHKITPWIEHQQKTFDRYHDVHLLTEEEWEMLEIDKLMIMDDVRKGAIAIIEEMCHDLPDSYGYTRYTNKSVEVVHKDSTKGSALRFLTNLLDVDIENVLAIGDHRNDMEMILEAGVGASVGNGIPEVKAVADYVSRGEYLEGVLEIVDKYCGVTVEREEG